MTDPILSVEGLVKRFGGVTAVEDASFTVTAGSVTGMIGPNGAGKTTLFDLVTGFQRPDGGTVRFDGHRIDRLSADRVSRLGIARTFQLVRLLPGLTALENLLVAARDHPGETVTGALFGGWQRREAEARRDALRWLEFVGMAHRADVKARDLSYGQSKLVELARALLLDARLIMLDEPMAGINPTLRRSLLALIHRLREEEGRSFLIIEHDIEMIMAECDEVIVMDRGTVIMKDRPDVVRHDPRVVEAYLGTRRQVRFSAPEKDGNAPNEPANEAKARDGATGDAERRSADSQEGQT